MADGGKGGDLTFVASPASQLLLLHFRFNPEHKAQRGRHGEGSNRTGHEGESIEVETPVGTVMYDDATGELIHDFTTPGEKFVVAQRWARRTRQRSIRDVNASGAGLNMKTGNPATNSSLRLELETSRRRSAWWDFPTPENPR